MQDRRWATGQDGRGGRLLEYVIVTIASIAVSLLVIHAVSGIVAGPMAQAAAALRDVAAMSPAPGRGG